MVTSSFVVHTGLLVVISIGVALGVAVGVFLLFALIACHRRYVMILRLALTTTTTTILISITIKFNQLIKLIIEKIFYF